MDFSKLQEELKTTISKSELLEKLCPYTIFEILESDFSKLKKELNIKISQSELLDKLTPKGCVLLNENGLGVSSNFKDEIPFNNSTMFGYVMLRPLSKNYEKVQITFKNKILNSKNEIEKENPSQIYWCEKIPTKNKDIYFYSAGISEKPKLAIKASNSKLKAYIPNLVRSINSDFNSCNYEISDITVFNKKGDAYHLLRDIPRGNTQTNLEVKIHKTS